MVFGEIVREDGQANGSRGAGERKEQDGGRLRRRNVELTPVTLRSPVYSCVARGSGDEAPAGLRLALRGGERTLIALLSRGRVVLARQRAESMGGTVVIKDCCLEHLCITCSGCAAQLWLLPPSADVSLLSCFAACLTLYSFRVYTGMLRPFFSHLLSSVLGKRLPAPGLRGAAGRPGPAELPGPVPAVPVPDAFRQPPAQAAPLLRLKRTCGGEAKWEAT